MAFSRFQAGLLLRVIGLVATLAILAWMTSRTGWYVTIALVTGAAIAQVVMLMDYAARSGREIARFLNAIAFDDTSAGFSTLTGDRAFVDLGAAMTRVLDRLRSGRAEREELAQYQQTLIAHVPVALVSVDEQGPVQLLNLAARRLFEGPCGEVAQFSRYGTVFATGMESLRPGDSMIVRMERPSGPLQLKAAATDITMGGIRRRLISLQNIETELSAQELAAWQAVIRVMAHEIMNSLTPISSLASTARGLVEDALAQSPAAAPARVNLVDASEALETIARRSEGLLHFVQNHRRLTKRMVVNIEIVPVRRIFARLQRLLAPELATRNIELSQSISPETLEVSVDTELFDQALINLVRNSMEALRDETAGRIVLSAYQDSSGRVVVAVTDNGPGIAVDQREKVFVPFFTTKRQGSGVGLTLVRQIATVHGAAITIGATPGGGATVSMRF